MPKKTANLMSKVPPKKKNANNYRRFFVCFVPPFCGGIFGFQDANGNKG